MNTIFKDSYTENTGIFTKQQCVDIPCVLISSFLVSFSHTWVGFWILASEIANLTRLNSCTTHTHTHALTCARAHTVSRRVCARSPPPPPPSGRPQSKASMSLWAWCEAEPGLYTALQFIPPARHLIPRIEGKMVPPKRVGMAACKCQSACSYIYWITIHTWTIHSRRAITRPSLRNRPKQTFCLLHAPVIFSDGQSHPNATKLQSLLVIIGLTTLIKKKKKSSYTSSYKLTFRSTLLLFFWNQIAESCLHWITNRLALNKYELQ